MTANSLPVSKHLLWFPTHGVDRTWPGTWIDYLLARSPYRLDSERRAIVVRSITELCLDRGWHLTDITAREMDVTAIVECAESPYRVLKSFKITATRALAALDGLGPQCRRFNRDARIRPLPGRSQFAEAAGAS